MDSVPLNTLDTTSMDILPCKVVMVKKPLGDGTHKKKGRVVVCGNFQQVQPGEETCANTPSFPMLRTLISLASLYRMGRGVLGRFNCIPVCTPLDV